jgi:glutamate dehydrogenase (NAD(P)+)
LIAELVEHPDTQQSTLDEFEQAADGLELSPRLRSLLRNPERVDRISVPIGLAGGSMEYFGGCRVQHSTARGPAKGGIRYRPGVTVNEIKAQAMRMTWQWALLDIPLGGGKGGIAVDLGKLPQEEVGRLTADPLEIAPALIPSPAAGQGHENGTARGLYCAAAAALRHLQVPMHRARVVIQGFGNVGSAAGLLWAGQRAAVIGASDTRGAVYNPAGLDISKLIRHKQRSGSVVAFPGAEPITDCELLALSCDLLVSAAVEHAIHGQNAPAVRARAIADVAGGAVTPKAASVLDSQGSLVIPGLLANAGWAAAHYDYSRLEGFLESGFRAALSLSRERKVDLRRAANMLAVARVAAELRS